METSATALMAGRAPVEAKMVTLPPGLTAALNTEQAAIYCGLAPATMEKLRCTGGGSRFVRYGRKAVRYLQRDLDEWMAARSVASTSEAA